MDLARGHVAAFDHLNKQQNSGCEVYNLGTGKGYSVLEMVAAFEKASGKQVSLSQFIWLEQFLYPLYLFPLSAVLNLKIADKNGEQSSQTR